MKNALCLTLAALSSLAHAGNDALFAAAKDTLPYPATLDYEGVKLDIRPESFRIKERDDQIDAIVRHMRRQDRSDEEIAALERSARASVPPLNPPEPDRLRIGFAADGIVYDHRFVGRKNSDRPVVWLTSVTQTRTLTFVHDGLSVYPGAKRSDVFEIPLPGVGLGNLPLVKPGGNPNSPYKADPRKGELWCQVLSRNPETNAFAYDNGRVDWHLQDGTPVVDRIRVGPHDAPYEDWRYSEYRKEDGRMLAHRIALCVTANDGPWYETTWILRSAESGALRGEDEILKLIRKGDPVTEYSEAGTVAKRYRYDPDKGEPLGAPTGMARAMAMGGAGSLLLGVVGLSRRRRSFR